MNILGEFRCFTSGELSYPVPIHSIIFIFILFFIVIMDWSRPEANADWDNANFHAKIAANQTNFALMVQSWNEQRDWGINFAVDALRGGSYGRDHPALAMIEEEFAAMMPIVVDPVASGFKLVEPGSSISSFGTFENVVIGTDGAIVNLTTSDGISLAGPDNKLGLLRWL